MRIGPTSKAAPGCTELFLPSGSGFISERGLSACFQHPLGVEEAVKPDEFGNESGPAGLVTGAEPGTIVAMEVFIEENVVAPADLRFGADEKTVPATCPCRGPFVIR